MKKDEPNNLSRIVTHSTLWIFLFQVMDNVLGFVRLMILARLLTPNDFGLIAIAWLVLQTLSAFTQTGIQQALIHKSKIAGDLNTAWTYLLMRGVLLYVVMYFSAPFLGSFFNNVAVVSIIRVMSLSLVMEGFTNIGVVSFQKDLKFQRQFVFQIVGNFIDFIVTLSLAFWLHSVWAIVYGSLANNITRLILSYILSSHRPKLEFNRSVIKELNNFGKWVTGSNILQLIYSQGDDFLVGKTLGSTSLGFYQLSYRISNLPATQITYVISSVMFPAYAKVQNDRGRVASMYLAVLEIVAYLSFFIGVVIICVSRDFTSLFLGDKWLPMVLTLQMLTVWGIIRSLGATTGPVWQALGTPKIITKIQFFQVILMVLVIYPLTMKLNIEGTALAVVTAALFPNILAVYLIKNTLGFSWYKYLTIIMYPLISSIVIAVLYFVTKKYFPQENIVVFFLRILLCGFVYFVITTLLSKFAKYTIFDTMYKFTRHIPVVNKFTQLIKVIF